VSAPHVLFLGLFVGGIKTVILLVLNREGFLAGFVMVSRSTGVPSASLGFVLDDKRGEGGDSFCRPWRLGDSGHLVRGMGKSKAAGRACPERSRRECPRHTFFFSDRFFGGNLDGYWWDTTAGSMAPWLTG
jgi:hypothetical protein